MSVSQRISLVQGKLHGNQVREGVLRQYRLVLNNVLYVGYMFWLFVKAIVM